MLNQSSHICNFILQDKSADEIEETDEIISIKIFHYHKFVIGSIP